MELVNVLWNRVIHSILMVIAYIMLKFGYDLNNAKIENVNEDHSEAAGVNANNSGAVEFRGDADFKVSSKIKNGEFSRVVECVDISETTVVSKSINASECETPTESITTLESTYIPTFIPISESLVALESDHVAGYMALRESMSASPPEAESIGVPESQAFTISKSAVESTNPYKYTTDRQISELETVPAPEPNPFPEYKSNPECFGAPQSMSAHAAPVSLHVRESVAARKTVVGDNIVAVTTWPDMKAISAVETMDTLESTSAGDGMIVTEPTVDFEPISVAETVGILEFTNLPDSLSAVIEFLMDISPEFVFEAMDILELASKLIYMPAKETSDETMDEIWPDRKSICAAEAKDLLESRADITPVSVSAFMPVVGSICVRKPICPVEAIAVLGSMNDIESICAGEIMPVLECTSATETIPVLKSISATKIMAELESTVDVNSTIAAVNTDDLESRGDAESRIVSKPPAVPELMAVGECMTDGESVAALQSTVVELHGDDFGHADCLPRSTHKGRGSFLNKVKENAWTITLFFIPVVIMAVLVHVSMKESVKRYSDVTGLTESMRDKNVDFVYYKDISNFN